MAIRRFAGLSLVGLFLLSVPTVAQTVAFVDEQGAETSTCLENSQARVRVTDPAANLYTFSRDTVLVNLAATLSGDSEPLVLIETEVSSGVFVGSIELARGGTPYQPGVLETSVDQGPPVVRDTLTAQYGSSTDTATLQGARLELLDDRGRPAAGFTHGDWIHVRVEEHFPYNDPYQRDSFSVSVGVPAFGDQEYVTLQETGNATGIFEGKIKASLYFGYSGDGVVGGLPGNLIHAEHDTLDVGETMEAEAPLVTARVEILNTAGEPVDYVAESSRVRLQVVDRITGYGGTVDTVQAEVISQIALDDEFVTLTETRMDSGVFEGEILLSLGPVLPYNGRFEITEDTGPPHRFDTIQFQYAGQSDTAGTYGSETRFVDPWGNDVEAYAMGAGVYLRVEDHNANQPAAFDSVPVTVQSRYSHDAETLALQETGQDTGIFTGSIAMVVQPTSPGNGQLEASYGEFLDATHLDALGNTASADVARVQQIYLQFIDEEGRPVQELVEGGTARVLLLSSIRNIYPYQVDTTTVSLQSLRGGDSETLQVTETGPNTGVFVGEIPMGFVSPGSASSGSSMLETSNSGSPQFLADEVTAMEGDAQVTIPIVGSRVWFVDAEGKDAAAYAVGELVRIRVEDHNLGGLGTRDSLSVQVTSPDSSEAETVVLTETGLATGVYEGSIPTAIGWYTMIGNGTLEVLTAQRIQVRHPHARDDREAMDEARITGSAVQFVDAGGQPVDVYLEATTARVRLVYREGNTLSTQVDSALVTLTSALAGDSETLTLAETGPNTAIFQGSMPLRTVAAFAGIPGNGFLETSSQSYPVARQDTLTVTHVHPGGTATDTATTEGARIWFIDAYGNPTETYAAGSTAYVRVEDHGADQPGIYNTVQVTVRSLTTGDLETLTIQETARDGGIFEGPLPLQRVEYPYTPTANDGRLQSQPGEEIEVVHAAASDRARILSSAAWFIDEAGVPTDEVLENGVARIRVVTSYLYGAGGSIGLTVRSQIANDQELLFLNETFYGSRVYEGTVQLSWVPGGGGLSGNGLLETSNSGAPQYLGDELTVTYEDGEGKATTIPSRVQLIDGFGRVASTFPVGGPVGVRVEDHNQDDPLTKRTFQVQVREAGSGDSDMLVVTETGFDTNVYEGTFGTSDGPVTPGDGVLQVQPGRVIEAEHPNAHTPAFTVAQATMSGASVLFVDEAGQPAEVVLEATRAHVRVMDSHAGSVTVTLQSVLGGDSESLALTQTGPGVFEGSLPLRSSSVFPSNGFLETVQDPGPPHEFDTLRVTYQSILGPVTDTVGTISSRTWFVDAYGNPTETYASGSTAYVRVEDHNADQPGIYNTVQVTVRSLYTGDLETLTVQETARDGGVFQGALPLQRVEFPYTPIANDGRLQSQPGEEIEVVHTDWTGVTTSSDRARLLFASATFIDEAGVTTDEVLENGVARLRVIDTSSYVYGSQINVTVRSRYANDQESVTLSETGYGTRVYEGTVQLSWVPMGGGLSGNGLLETSNSGMPAYLGDELTVTYQDGEGRAVTIPSRVQFIDGFGRVATTFPVGGPVGVRVEDHNQDDPLTRRTFQVQVREAGSGDSDMLEVIETGFDTNVYEGSFGTADGPVVPGDGVLQVQPGRVIEAEHPNAHTPSFTVAQATMSGASVLFVDEAGQPAEIYLEATRAYVRVRDAYAGSVTVTLQSVLGGDSESLPLTQTGPGVFEGSLPLRTGPPASSNGFLETTQDPGPPHEFDTLRVTHQSISGPVTDTVGTIGSRTWFVDAYGNPTETYAAGSTAHIRVEDHNFDQPGIYNTVQVTVRSLYTGDLETITLQETARDGGIFEGPLPLQRVEYPYPSAPNDGQLQSQAGEEIEVVHTDWMLSTSSSDRARLLFASATFIDEAGVTTDEVLENGVARLRVVDTSPFVYGSQVTVAVRSRYANDQESVTLIEAGYGTHVYEGTVQLSWVPLGAGLSGNGLLETSNSSMPAYLGDELTVIYQDGEGRAVTIPSRVQFIDGFGRVATTFPVGGPVGVRVEDHNQDDPLTKRTFQIQVREAGSGDADMLEVTETGFDTNVYEGTFGTANGPVVPGDGVLQVQPGRVIEAEHPNAHTPAFTVAQATMSGASVLFVDAAGQPAAVVFESSRARVRVNDAYASSVTVVVQTLLGGDSESLPLTQTGPGVFEGSLPLRQGPPVSSNGFLETTQDPGPPHEFDTLRATYLSTAGEVTDTVGTIGSRTWFIDAYGNLTETYAAGSTARVRVEDHNFDQPGIYNTVQVTVRSLYTGDLETVTLQETARDGGIFEGPLPLQRVEYPYPSTPNDGQLQSQAGEEIEAVHTDWGLSTSSSDRARLLFASATFVDEAGVTTDEVLENGVARLRVIDTSPFVYGSQVTVTVRSRYANDQESVTLNETFYGTHVYEGTVQLSWVPLGGGLSGNSLLETSNSSMPAYLGDELTVTYQDGEGRAVTIPSRVQLIDGFGRVSTTFPVGGPVGVRVEDHNQDDPLTRRTFQVQVREAGSGDSDMLEVIETGFDTNVYEGTFGTADGPVVPGDGVLQVQPGRVIEAEHPNAHTPAFTVAQATMSGASVLFVDAAGQPAEVVLESSRAYVRVRDAHAGSVTVTLQSVLGGDNESLPLTQTGPGVFEGSLPLRTGPPVSSNGFLETTQDPGPPHEFDTLRVTHQTAYGPVTDTVGTIGSRTWFVDAYGNLTDTYAAGSSARIRVEDHNFDQPGIYNAVQVTVRSLMTGDLETVTLQETARDGGIFEGPLPLQSVGYPYTPTANDGLLQSQPGEEIEAVHTDWGLSTSSSDRARLLFAAAWFIDEAGATTDEVLENGVARLRVASSSYAYGSPISVTVRSRYANDQETVTLNETPYGSHVYEGTVQLSWVPLGGGLSGNGLLETSNSSMPAYLGDELTVIAQDGEGRAVTIPSRVQFIDGFGRVATTFPVGGPVGVRVEDHNQDDPLTRRTFQVQVREAGSGDSDMLEVTETGFDTNVYEGTFGTADGPVMPGDGVLQVQPGRVIEAEHPNAHTPAFTVAQATMSGASVLFVDAAGQPAEVVFESSRAYVRVRDVHAGSVTVTVQTLLGGDSESLALTQTGPGVFEGSLPLRQWPSVEPNSGYLETRQDPGPPHELDTLRATYQSTLGPLTDTVGTIGSRTWFADANGNPAETYAATSTAWVRVEDHNFDQPGISNTVQVTVRSLLTGDLETVTLQEAGLDSGIFAGSLPLQRVDYPYVPTAGDGQLQSQPGEEIEVVHTDWTLSTSSSDRARLLYAAALFVDETGAATGEVLENGTARIRVIDSSPTSQGSIGVTVRSRYAADQETVTLTETPFGSRVYEGTVQLSRVPLGGGLSGNSLLETSNSGMPEYLGDELTVTYQDGEGRAVTVPSRVRFLDLQGAPTSGYAVRSTVRVRVEDRNVNDPGAVDTTTVLLTVPGDSETLTLTETGADTGLFEGSLPSSDAPGAAGDGTLTAAAGTVAVAQHVNAFTPNPTTAQATFAGNFAPVAVDDTAEAMEQPVVIPVLANDSDPDAEALHVASVTQGAHGTVAINADQTVTYSPAAGFLGSDSFTYVVSDPRGGQARATVTVTVIVANLPPTPAADTAITPEDQAVNVPVLANDTDPDNDTLQVVSVTQPANGSAALQPDNTITFSPAANWSGETSFTYTVRDPGGLTATATVTVTVTPVNDPPVAIDDAATTDEDVAVTIAVLENDRDLDGDVLDVTSVTGGAHGYAVVNADNTITFTPAESFSGTVTFDYLLSDGNPPSDAGTVTVTINPVNDAPVALDDTTEVAEDSSGQVWVLTNDSDAEGDALDVTAVTQGAHGTVVLNADDTVTYTPNADYSGGDSFTYTVIDGHGGSDTATVSVNVVAASDSPVAADDTATTAEDTPVTVSVLANDNDPDDDPLTVTAVTQGTDGSVAIAGSQVTYTPNADFHGTDSFTYTVSDGNSGTDTAPVTVTVTAVNDAPVAGNDTATVAEDSSVSVTVLANDSDADGDALDVTAVTQGTHGSVVLNADDTVTYTPNADFNGSDSFTYTVSDGNGGSATGTVSVTVTAANDAPVANDDSATVAEDTPVTVSVLGNDSDPDNDTLTVSAVTQGTNGSVAIVGSQVTYTPNTNFNGTDSFTYAASDGNGGTDTATVTVTVTAANDAPVANDDSSSVVEDGSVAVAVLGNDTDIDGDSLTITAVTQGTNGTVAITGSTVTYTPAPNFNGTDSFTYTVSDGNGGADTATVTMTITASNDALTANDDTATVAEDGSVTVAVLANDTDPENDPLTLVSVTQGTNGTVAIVGNQVTYTPNANFNGTDSFTYTASDGNGGTGGATVTVTVTPVNDAPVANDDVASVVEDGSVSVTVLGNDTDVDGDSLTVTAVTQGTNGAVAIDGNQVVYTPAANFHGTDSFTYTVSDGNGGTDTATVTVTVGAANDAPVANGDSASTAEDTAVSLSVLANDTDLDGDTLSVASVTQGSNGAVTISGTQVVYTPGANFHGSDSFTYTVSDGNGGTASATVAVTITPVNDAPVAGADTASVAEDGSVAISVLGNDTDVDGDTLAVTSVTQGAHGAVTHNGSTVTYTPAANYNGPDSFTYTVSDGNGGTATGTVSVTVTGTNDAPVANGDSASTAEDTAVSLSVLANDSDLDGDTLSITAVTQGAHGSVSINGSQVVYTPAANYNGPDSFTYTASDGHGGTAAASVSITVTAVNDAPVAVNDSATTTAEVPVTISVRANDTDVEGNTLTITAVTQGAHGSVAINAGATVTYTPATAWVGPDSFTYTISDGAGGTATATVSVNVQAPPRVTGNLQVLYTFNEGSGTTVNDVSGVGTPLNLTISSSSAVTWLPGALSLNSPVLVESATAATKVINACKSSNEVTVEAWVAPDNTTQTGPAAIASIAQNATKRNVTLGQSTTAYNGQLRTSTTGLAGTALNTGAVVSLALTHVVYTRSSTGAVRIYVNGTQVASSTLTGNFSNWASFNLALGGEPSGTRYWVGDMHLVAIYSRALTAAEARQNWLAGAN